MKIHELNQSITHGKVISLFNKHNNTHFFFFIRLMVVFVLRVKSTRQSLPRVNGSVRERCPLAFEVGCCGIDLCDAGNYSVQFIRSTEGL